MDMDVEWIREALQKWLVGGAYNAKLYDIL